MSAAPAKAIVIGIVMVLSSCVSRDAYLKSLAANDALRSERDSLAGHLSSLEDQNARLAAQVEGLSRTAADADWVREQRAKIDQILRELENSGPVGGLPAGVSLAQGPEGIVVSVEGEVLFASGRAEIMVSGAETLNQLAAVLKQENRMMRIEGHTDSDPIRNSSWKTNLRLSSARSLAVADFLIGAGVPEERISVSAYGPFRPKDSGTGAESKRANRRVEILLLDR
ncbi:MAG: OmpA/MotB family protein [Planctomycetota bacterium]|jgi:flagellar motor protein MotB